MGCLGTHQVHACEHAACRGHNPALGAPHQLDDRAAAGRQQLGQEVEDGEVMKDRE